MTGRDDFTEASYAKLLAKAKARFAVRPVGEGLGADGIALWRHDIDFSPHRALALATLEAAMGLSSSYFVMVSSTAYNAFEPAVRDILRAIAGLGHELGLHFDGAAEEASSVGEVEARLDFEAKTLARLLRTPIRSFSIHNPTVGEARLDERRHAGLVNASAPSLYREFEYCSDSNGLWRFRSLTEVIDDPAVRRLYALTHPEWWQATAMPPRRRIQRCIDGRAVHAAADYDQLLSAHRRPNADAMPVSPSPPKGVTQ